MSTSQKAWINALFLAITLVINTFGAIGKINGFSQKEISDMYPTLITPNPPTFSIWSIIYLLLVLSCTAMIINRKDPYYENAINHISGLFWISCLLNVAWILAFSFIQIELSVVFILGLAIILASICKELLHIQENRGRRWLLPLSFGLYAGWLFIATVVNISAALVKLKWNGFGLANEVWAAIILITAVFLVIAVQMNNHNAVFSLPVAWAYFGIYQSLKSSGDNGERFAFLQIILLAGIAVLIGSFLIHFFTNRFSLLPMSNEKTKL